MNSPEFNYGFEPAPDIKKEREELRSQIFRKQGLNVNSDFPYTFGLGVRDLNRKLIGLAEIYRVRNRGEFSFFVHPDHQNMGIGKTLLEKMIFRCIEEGLTEITATAIPGSASEVILKSRGFQEYNSDMLMRIKKLTVFPRTHLKLQL